MITSLKTFINGLAFGVTQLVPGVSGGTVAIIMGFYGQLLESVNHFGKDRRKHTKFLAPFLLGIAAGILVFSSIINFLLINYSLTTMSFFIGLIVGIIPPVYAKIKIPGQMLRPGEIALILVPVLALAAVSHIRGAAPSEPAAVIGSAGPPYLLFIFVAGVIAAAALVTPGVSGSFILLLMGAYDVIIYSVSSVRHLLGDITDTALWLDILKIMLPFALGVVAGGLSMARLIEKLLRDFHRVMYLIILGLLLGSVYALLNNPAVYQSGVGALSVVISALAFVAGCVLSCVIGKKRV
jgi:putative membrane protein